MRRDRTVSSFAAFAASNAFNAQALRNIVFTGLLAMASEAGAEARFLDFSFPAGSTPRFVAVADLDGNRVPDLVVANVGIHRVSVLLGNGDGSFQAPVSHAVGRAPASVAVADFDGDTVPDLVSSNFESDDVSVLPGRGDGTFHTAIAFAAGDGPRSVAVGDFDDDGTPDLVIANINSDDVSVLLGNGDGSFRAAVFFAVGDSPDSVAVADLDGDTILDLVTANALFSDDVSVLLGKGDGSFRAARSFPIGDGVVISGPNSVAVADLDGDQVPDLVTANAFTDDASLLLGNGDGTFQPVRSFGAGDIPASVAVADLDCDQVLDLVVANFFSDDVSVLVGNGDGSYQAAVSFPVGDAVFSVAAADLDGDGLPDLVTANRLSNDVTVLLNLCEPPVALEIDIKPGNDLNSINPFSRGVIPVAILGTDKVDVADLDAASLAFGPDGARLAHRNGPHVKDTSRDGQKDLLGHFRTEEAGLAIGDSEACVTGATLAGTPFEACDSIRTVGHETGPQHGSCGLGFELCVLLPSLTLLRRSRRRRILESREVRRTQSCRSRNAALSWNSPGESSGVSPNFPGAA